MSLRPSAATAVPPPRLVPPRPLGDAVSRLRLLRRLDEASGMPCLLAAPLGFGKTTLLAQWARAARDGRVAWLSLDESEADPAVLWAHVAAALGADEDEAEPTLAGAVALAEATAAGALVLDGYERIAGSPSETELWRFVGERPSLQVVVAGRGEPSAPLAAARARGELIELRSGDLRFERREALEFAGRSDGVGVGGAAEELVDACAGWPAALRLALAAPSQDAWEEQVLDLVTNEVLRDRPDAETFLRRTALLEELSPAACDHVLRTEGSADVLAELEYRQLLVERSGDDGTYRLEPAARRVLADDLAWSERRVLTELHRRAAAAERAAGHLDRAVDHLLACGDTEDARRAVGATWERVADSGGHAHALQWLERLPAGQNVRLALARGWLLRLDGRRAESEHWLEVARTAAPLRARPAVVRACVLAQAAIPWDDIGQAMTLARRAWRTERNGPRRALAAWALGWASWWSGDIEAAEVALLDAFDGPRLVEIAGLAVLARIDLERRDLAAAEAHVTAAEALAAEDELERLPELGMLATARGVLLTAHGSGAVALGPLERGIRLRRLWGHPLETADALAAAAPVVAAERGRRAAGALLAEARMLLHACADPGVLPERLAAARRASLPRPAAGAYDELTPRERTVLSLLAQGRSKRQIAQELFVSFNTVHSHTKAVYRKLGVSSRHEAIERAAEITLR